MGPVSATGRSMMASLQQAMQKGMPTDQAIAYVKSMAQQGVAPLTDLYAMLNQFQRLKQPQAQAPQTPPTIKDQINMAAQQRAAQDAMMGQGLGAVNAGSMENPQFAGGGIVAFSNGGSSNSVFETTGAPISRFTDITEGEFLSPGEEEEFDKLIDLQRNVFSSPYVDSASLNLWERNKDRYKQLLAKREAGKRSDIAARSEAATAAEAKRRGITLSAKPAAAAAPAAVTGKGTPAPSAALLGGAGTDFAPARKILGDLRTGLQTEAGKTADERIAETAALQEKYGIGEAGKKRGEYLTKREAEAEQDLSRDKRLALAQAGFAMAEAASRRGRDRTGFLGAAAIGGTQGAKLYQAALKENRAIKDKIQDNRFALDQANEMIKAGNIEKGTALAREAQANLRALDQARAQTELSIAEFTGRERGADRRLGAQLASQKERYAQAAQIQREKLLSDLLESGALGSDPDEISKKLAGIFSAFSGKGGTLSGTIEDIEEE